MTDAEVWRKIAEERKFAYGTGLCHQLRQFLVVASPMPASQFGRLSRALDLFDNGKVWYWPKTPGGHWDRTWAAIMLAGMAEADGGNHMRR